MIKVSVIVPVKNAELYLRQCLDSIVNQTLKEIEIICVDDGSADGSLKILQEYAVSDDRIIILSQKNCGAGAARNKGFDAARGKYVIFLDSDDYFELNMLELCYQKLEEDIADIVVFKYQILNMKQHTLTPCLYNCSSICSPFSLADMADNYSVYFPGFVWDKMFRRAFLMENKLRFQEIPKWNDIYFCRMSLFLATRISFISNILATYRVEGGGSITDLRRLTPEVFLLVFKRIKSAMMERNIYDTFERGFKNDVLSFIVCCLNAEKPYPFAFAKCYYGIKHEVEQEFGLLNHPCDYYNSEGLYLSYKSIFNNDTMEELYKFGLSGIYAKKLVVYGTGAIGKSLIPFLSNDSNISLIGVCTSNTERSGMWAYEDFRFPLHSISRWKELVPDAAILIATIERYHEEIADTCRQAGFKDIIPAWQELILAGCSFDNQRILDRCKSAADDDV